MLEKEKYYRLKLFKKIFLILFLIINFSIQNSFASSNQSKIEAVKKIKENLIKTNSLSFLFKQMIGKKIEVGKCLAKYPKLMHCYYDNKEKKELISDGYTFAIFKKKYNKIYLYPLITVSLKHLLDKDFILKELSHMRTMKMTDKIIEYEIYNKKQKFIVIFDSKTFEISGWKTIDIFQNDVEFIIYNVKKNIVIEKDEFKIPRLN